MASNINSENNLKSMFVDKVLPEPNNQQLGIAAKISELPLPIQAAQAPAQSVNSNNIYSTTPPLEDERDERPQISAQDIFVIKQQLAALPRRYVNEHVRCGPDEYPVSQQAIKNEALTLIVFTTLEEGSINESIQLWETAGHSHSYYHILKERYL